MIIGMAFLIHRNVGKNMKLERNTTGSGTVAV